MYLGYVEQAFVLIRGLEEKLIDSFWLQETVSHFPCVFEDIATVSEQHFFPRRFQFYELVVIRNVNTDTAPTDCKSKVSYVYSHLGSCQTHPTAFESDKSE